MAFQICLTGNTGAIDQNRRGPQLLCDAIHGLGDSPGGGDIDDIPVAVWFELILRLTELFLLNVKKTDGEGVCDKLFG